MPQRKQQQRKQRRAKVGSMPTYKMWCDNHPSERATHSFVDGTDGKLRGLCQECFDEERDRAVRRMERRKRIKRARAKRK